MRKLPTNFVFLSANDILAGGMDYAKAVFKEVAEVDKAWFSQCPIAVTDDLEFMSLLRESNCFGLLVGFESIYGQGGLKKLARAGETNRYDDYLERVQIFHRHGIALIGCFVFGMDGQRSDIFDLTKKLIRKANIDIPQLTISTAFPGSKLRDRMVTEERLIKDRETAWRFYDVVHPTHFPRQEDMSFMDLVGGYGDLCREIYSYKEIVRRVVRSTMYLRKIQPFGTVMTCNMVYRQLAEQRHKEPKIAPPPGYYQRFEK